MNVVLHFCQRIVQWDSRISRDCIYLLVFNMCTNKTSLLVLGTNSVRAELDGVPVLSCLPLVPTALRRLRWIRHCRLFRCDASLRKTQDLTVKCIVFIRNGQHVREHALKCCAKYFSRCLHRRRGRPASARGRCACGRSTIPCSGARTYASRQQGLGRCRQVRPPPSL